MHDGLPECFFSEFVVIDFAIKIFAEIRKADQNLKIHSKSYKNFSLVVLAVAKNEYKVKIVKFKMADLIWRQLYKKIINLA